MKKQIALVSWPCLFALMFLFASVTASITSAQDKDFVKKGYAGGVPMGGDLVAKPDTAKTPTFVVTALKDPESGNLDRIQIIKGWYDRGYPGLRHILP